MKKRWEWKCKLKWNGMETRIGGLKKTKEGKKWQKQEVGRREFNFEDTTKYFGFWQDVCNHEN
jgi:hypothetical protein